MKGGNGIAGRRGGRETASAPVSDAREDAASATETAWLTVRIIADRAKRCDTLAALDALAADVEDAAQYIPEGGDGALAEAVRREMLAAIDERRELIAARAIAAEAVRAAQDCLTVAQQAEAEKRGAIETARAVGAFGGAKQSEVADRAGVKVRTVKAWEAAEKCGAHNKLPRVIKRDGSVETYSRLLRKDYPTCMAWCDDYRTQKENARLARATLAR